MSMREFLKGLELDTETIDSIMAEYGKNMQGLKEQNETLKTENKDLKDKEAEYKKTDIEAIKKEEYDKGVAEGNKQVETFKKTMALEKELASTKAKDVTLLQKLIDNDKINYEEKDGNFVVKGLEDQIKSIKETHSYLFEEENTNKPGIDLGGEHKGNPPKSEATTLLGALHEKYDK